MATTTVKKKASMEELKAAAYELMPHDNLAELRATLLAERARCQGRIELIDLLLANIADEECRPAGKKEEEEEKGQQMDDDEYDDEYDDSPPTEEERREAQEFINLCTDSELDRVCAELELGPWGDYRAELAFRVVLEEHTGRII